MEDLIKGLASAVQLGYISKYEARVIIMRYVKEKYNLTMTIKKKAEADEYTKL